MKLLGGSVFGHSLRSFRNSVLGQLSGEEKTDCSLDFSGGDGGPLVVVSETRRFGSDSLKDIVHEGVHDAHGLGRDASVRVDLLQDLINVNGIGFFPLVGSPLSGSFGDILFGLFLPS
ncbi:H2B [Lepeophtheirus salmonis]|uniref:H2B n=1 Tax=Lepeophtheirus salmonis TaxID=72036 RepID=A0A7R8D6W4_LEPSM|nr:H2B [Lepeophtheirus salmonis]CAF2993967.1 H2B [Lepeophtheirus salmonis]